MAVKISSMKSNEMAINEMSWYRRHQRNQPASRINISSVMISMTAISINET